MGIIHKLTSHEAQKIAAGEVVERPYNIVKELLENSLDAGATHITLHVQDGGRKALRCIDNGCGMTHEDALMSVEHHATSKLTTIDDLETLKTFGFRGEALSSICAVSNLTLVTQMAGQEHGVALTFECGVLKTTDIISRPVGTDIRIDDIFDNVPVRKKFLKSRETEWRAIHTLVQAMALAHTHVAFQLYHDNQPVLTTHATESLKERVAQLFDRSFATQFLELSPQTERDIQLFGGITHYQYQRYDRNQQFFFVNKRWVKNYKLGQAFNKGFLNVMPPGKQPAGIIFIQLPQGEVDINVHPRKEEVVFLHPRLIELTIERMVQQRLEAETASRVMTSMPIAPIPVRTEWPSTQAIPQVHAPKAQQLTTQEHAPTPHPVWEPESTAPVAPHYTIVGQLLKTYVLLETQQGLLIVDQHAAHECVLYEQFSSKNNDVARIQLLFPEIIQVVPGEQKTLMALADELNMLGFTLEPAGETAVAITQTPLHVKNYPLKEFIYDILSFVGEQAAFDAQFWHTRISKKVYAMMACKAAVKAGDELSSMQIEELLRSLYKTEHRLTCPHGRPTTWMISQYELEKTFKRKV